MTIVRSPNYPAISFPDAIERVKLVYKQENKHPADKEVVAKAIGYGSWNGGSSVVVSALLKYGLLEHTGKNSQLRVSADAIDILLHHPGEPDRVKAVRKLAFMPTLFNELHSTYGDIVPSDHNLTVSLVKKGFNPKTVDGVIRSYRGTIEFVNEETQDSDIEFLEEVQSEVPMQTHTFKQAVTDQTSDGVWSKDVPTSSGKGSDELVLGFKIAEDCDVRTVFKGRVTQEALRKFIAHLELSMDVFPTKEKLQETSDNEDM